jgi:hypothetical protein
MNPTTQNPLRIYVYKCVVDDGGAPCVEDGLLSLTICKPYIRSTVQPGDLVFAFGSNDDTQVPKNRLVYIAQVGTTILRNGEYFRRHEFHRRADCIYEWSSPHELKLKKGARFHITGSGVSSDLGKAPSYSKANAFVTDEFRYFGDKGDASWKTNAPNLTMLVEKLGQGHRVTLTAKLEKELLDLRGEVWQRFQSEKVIGRPLHSHGAATGGASEDSECVRICGPRCDYKRTEKSSRDDPWC